MSIELTFVIGVLLIAVIALRAILGISMVDAYKTDMAEYKQSIKDKS